MMANPADRCQEGFKAGKDGPLRGPVAAHDFQRRTDRPCLAAVRMDLYFRKAIAMISAP